MNKEIAMINTHNKGGAGCIVIKTEPQQFSVSSIGEGYTNLSCPLKTLPSLKTVGQCNREYLHEQLDAFLDELVRSSNGPD